MAFDPVTWAIGFGVGKAVNKLLDLSKDELGKALSKDVRDWAETLPEDLSCTPEALFPNTEDNVFIERAKQYAGIQKLRQTLEAKNVPDASVWFDAFMDKWRFVMVTTAQSQAFFQKSREDEVRAHLQVLAEKVAKTSATDEDRFRVTTLELLRVIKADIQGKNKLEWTEADIAQAQQHLQTMPDDEIPEPSVLPSNSVMPLARNPLFVGRSLEFKSLAESLKQGEVVQIAAATGIGGIGKTQLACAFVHRYGQYFKGGVYWLSFAEEDNIKTEVANCGSSKGMGLYWEGETNLDQQVDRVLAEWRKPIPRLLVFDNCESQELFDQWRPKTGNCRVLITSRNPDWEDHLDVKAVPLGVLSEAEAVALLKKFYPKDSEGLAEIARELGCLPLALHLAGSYLKKKRAMTPSKYLKQLRDASILAHASLNGQFNKISPTNHIQNVGRTFSLSYDLLDPIDPTDELAIQLLQKAACLAPGEPIPTDLLIEVSDGEEEPVDEALDRLKQLGLLEEEEQSIKLHRLLAVFIRNLGIRQVVQRSLEEAVLKKADILNTAGFPAPLLEWQIHLKALTDHAIEQKSELAGDLCNELGYHFLMVASFSSCKPYFEQALAIRMEVLGVEHLRTTVSLSNLGILLKAMGDFGAARPYLEQALASNRVALGEDHPQTAVNLNNLGGLLQDMGEYGAARPCYEQALAICRKVLGGDHPDVALSLNNLGELHQEMGEHGFAKRYLEQALAIRRKALGDDHLDVARTLNNLGGLHQIVGEHGEARRYFAEALTIKKKALGENHPDTANTLDNLGGLLLCMEELGDVRHYFEQAFAIRKTVLGEDHHDTARSLNNLGMHAYFTGDYKLAISYLQQSIDIVEQRLGPNHPMTCAIRENLAFVLANSPSKRLGFGLF